MRPFDDAALKERVGKLKIIARARPMDKKRLVEALQANNEVVAVTGDGTNDALNFESGSCRPFDGRWHVGG